MSFSFYNILLYEFHNIMYYKNFVLVVVSNLKTVTRNLKKRITFLTV